MPPRIATRWRRSWRRLRRLKGRGSRACARRAELRATRPRHGPKACGAGDRRSSLRLVAMSGAQAGNDQGVLPEFALGMAAADPHNSAISGSRMRTAPAWSPSAKALTPRQRPIAQGPGASLPSACRVLPFAPIWPAMRVAAGRRGDQRVVDIAQNARRPAGRIVRHRRRHPANSGSRPVLPASESRHSSEAESVKTLSGG